MKWVDSFCRKYPRFGLPDLMKYIVFGNAIAFVLILMDPSGRLWQLMIFDAAALLRGEVWRLFTFILIPPDSSIYFIAIALYFYYYIGSVLEADWGTARFTLYYIVSAVLTVAYCLIMALLLGGGGYATAHYINLSLLFCFATVHPNIEFLVFFILPVKAKWLAVIDAGYFLYAIATMPGYTRFIPLVALLSYPIFCWQDIMYHLPSLFKAGPRRSGRVVEFKRAVKSAKPYASKCTVCGKTDTEYPGLEFRYCSQCAGYHCFCEEHIGNHSHFQS